MAVQSYSQDVRYSSADAKLMALVSAQVAASIRRKRSEEELRASEDRFAKAFRANPDAVSINRLEDGRFLVVNEGFTRVFGWSEAEVLGRTSLADGLDLWVDPEDRRRMTEALERSGRVEGLEVTFRRRDGGFVAGLVSSTLIEVAGKPCSLTITRDVTVLRAQARQLERMTRIYAAHSQVSQAVVRFPNEQEMLERICQVLVEDGKFTLAWLGWNDPATSQIRVAAQSGDAAGFLDEFPIRSDDTPLGRRPAGTAIREGRTVFLNDFVAATEHSPWGGAAVRAGFQACAALPIRRAGQVRGVLVVYAREKGFFGELEVALLEEVAATVSYAVDHGDLERGRLLAERNLRLEHDRAETYLRVAGVILLALDPELRVAMLNRKGYDVAGRPEGSLLGQDWLAATAPPGIAEGTRDQLLRVLRSGTAVPFTQEAWLVRGDNDRRLIAWTNTVLRDEEGRPTGLLCSGEDLTERRRTEEERESLQAQLAQAQKLESLGSLAGGVAHDMNNVLAAILALASTQTEGTASGGPAPGSPAHRAFERIIQAAVRGGKMVKTLLSFARKNPTETREVDLGALLREQAQLLEHTTLSRVRVELDLAPELRPVRGDASALSHVFLNLCVNAVDAMPEGGTLTLRTRNLEGDQVEVEVADTGVGMPPEVLGKALDPFFTTKAEGRGTGLGLSMAYSTVKAHLGTITIQSEPGRGTRVRLVFPAMAPGAAPEPEPRRTGPGHPASLKVLLVDDDDLVRESESVCLETLGHSVLQAASGEEGLAILEEGFHPDLVVLDMNMPGLGGAGTLDLLRKWRPATPVIVATGRVDQSALDMVGAHPGVTLLPKPFDLQDLKAHLDRIPWA
jgi:PAS domain S-box-containing protein